VGAVSAAVGAILASGAGPERVNGSLTHLGSTEFTLDSAPGEATSPVCGCYKIRHRRDWRGVTFASRKVEISRQIGGRSSTYEITASSPEAATWAPGELYFPAELITLRHVDGGGLAPRFSPGALVAGKAPAGWRVVTRRKLGEQPLALIHSRAPIYVSMLGPTPIGAWIPAESGNVSLGFHQGLTPAAPVEGELTEHDRSPTLWGRLSHPLADFLGPDVVVWTRDRRAAVETEYSLLSSRLTSPHGRVVVALVVRHPPFALRVAAMPIVVPPRLIEGEIAAGGLNDRSGPYRMVLKGKPVTTTEYRRMRATLTRHDVVVHRVTGYFASPRPDDEPYETHNCHDGRCEIYVRESLQENHPERFRYPPRPPTAQGFTVFGPLRSLRLSEGEGAFGSFDQLVAAPTEMRLRGVKMLGPEGEAVMSVPADEKGYQVDLSAAGSSVVGGKALAPDESFDWQTALVVAGILTGMLGLFFGALAWFGRDRTSA
jgi:hypothetical protein